MFEFVKLKELYYAGSHGMDIVTSVSAHSTEKVRLSCSSHWIQHFAYSLHTVMCKILKKSLEFYLQCKEANLFQPACEFLPMIDEVCLSTVYNYHTNKLHYLIQMVTISLFDLSGILYLFLISNLSNLRANAEPHFNNRFPSPSWRSRVELKAQGLRTTSSVYLYITAT